MPDVAMPRLSDSMEEGTIIKWLRSDGDAITRGEELVEIETDKANMVHEADADGTLAIVAQEGDTLAVGATIARIGDASELAGAGGGDAGADDAGAANEAGTAPSDLDSATASEAGAGTEPATASATGPGADPATASETGAGTDPATANEAGAGADPATAGATGTSADPATAGATGTSADPATASEAGAGSDGVLASAGAAGTAEPTGDGNGRVKASPIARRMARDLGVELGSVTGSGPGGRVVKADVEAAAGGTQPGAATTLAGSGATAGGDADDAPDGAGSLTTAAATAGATTLAGSGATAGGDADDAPDGAGSLTTAAVTTGAATLAVTAAAAGAATADTAPATTATPAAGTASSAGTAAAPAAVATAGAAAAGADQGKGTTTVEELSRLQKTIARRMAESKATAPEFVLTCEVDMEDAVAFRAQLKQAAGEDPAPSFNDFVVKAAALALREFPRANGAYRDGRFELYSRVNVGIAVAAQDALIVPTIFDADRKSLGEIGRDARALAGKVRDGAITPPELASGTFSVSNLGMFGIKRFTAVINPPQAAILAVGELTPRPVARDGEIVVRTLLELTLTCDHRILYGADAAQFLGRIRERLENPLTLTL